MLIESHYATAYFMAVVMSALSVAVLEIFAFEMFKTLTLTFRMSQGQM